MGLEVHHRSVANVLENATDVAVDVANPERRIGHHFSLDAERELVDERHLRVGIDEAGCGVLQDEVVGDSTGEYASRNRTGQRGVEVVRTAR